MDKRLKRTRLKYLAWLYFLITLAIPVSAYSRDFHWAGVGFLGDYSQRDSLYPISSRINEQELCEGVSCFEVYARNVFANKSLAGGTITLTQAEPGSNSIGVALGISYERVIVDKTGPAKKNGLDTITNFAIFGSLLFMDLDTNKLLGSVPSLIRYADASSGDLSDEKIYEYFKKLLTSNELKLSFAMDAFDRAAKYRLPESKVIRAQVTKSLTDEKPLGLLKMDASKVEDWNLQMAQIFEMAVMSEMPVQMLPSAVGHVVGGKLKTRLSSGDREISLPEPDVGIQLRLRKLVEIKKPNSAGTGKTRCFASVVDISSSDAFGDSLFSHTLQNISKCKFYANEDRISVPISFEKSVFGLISKTAKAIANPDGSSKFFKKSSPKKSSQVKSDFEKLNKLVTN